MSKQVDDSGEWRVGYGRERAERLKTFRPIDPKTGKLATDARWAEIMNVKQTTFSGLLAGNPMKETTIYKIKTWMVTKGGYTIEHVAWFMWGGPVPQLAVGGLAERRKIPRAKLSMALSVPLKNEAPSLPLKGKRRNGQPVSHEEKK